MKKICIANFTGVCDIAWNFAPDSGGRRKVRAQRSYIHNKFHGNLTVELDEGPNLPW